MANDNPHANPPYRPYLPRPAAPVVGEEPTPEQLPYSLDHEPSMEERADDPYKGVRNQPARPRHGFWLR